MVRRSSVLLGLTLGSAGVWAAVNPAHSLRYDRQDIDAGGHIENIAGGKRFVVKQRTDTAPGRAELRGASSMTEVVAGGRFRLIAGGRWLSILQVLNVKAPGETGGASKPVAQLGIRLKPGSADRYQFFIVQGAQPCTNVPDFAIGTYHRISVSAKAGGDPDYRIDGFRCALPNPSGDKVGIVAEGPGAGGGHYFYAKLGAYQTLSNKDRQGGESTVEWTDIHI